MTDETNLERLADRIMDEPVLAEVGPDTRASIGREIALAYGQQIGLTDEGAKELATLVESRIESINSVKTDHDRKCLHLWH